MKWTLFYVPGRYKFFRGDSKGGIKNKTINTQGKTEKIVQVKFDNVPIIGEILSYKAEPKYLIGEDEYYQSYKLDLAKTVIELFNQKNKDATQKLLFLERVPEGSKVGKDGKYYDTESGIFALDNGKIFSYWLDYDKEKGYWLDRLKEIKPEALK